MRLSKRATSYKLTCTGSRSLENTVCHDSRQTHSHLHWHHGPEENNCKLHPSQLQTALSHAFHFSALSLLRGAAAPAKRMQNLWNPRQPCVASGNGSATSEPVTFLRGSSVQEPAVPVSEDRYALQISSQTRLGLPRTSQLVCCPILGLVVHVLGILGSLRRRLGGKLIIRDGLSRLVSRLHEITRPRRVWSEFSQ